MSFSNRLPDETLATIFTHFLPPVLPSADLPSLLALSTVCKRFRRFLLPEIYGTLVYTYAPPPPARSAGRPIDWAALLATADADWDDDDSDDSSQDGTVPALLDEPIRIDMPRWMELDVEHQRQFRLLLRSLWENPFLGALVRSFRCGVLENPDNLPTILQAVTEACPALEEVAVSFGRGQWWPPRRPRDDPRPFLPSGLKHLVWVSSSDATARAVVELLTPLKHLESVCLSLGSAWKSELDQATNLTLLRGLDLRTVVPPRTFRTLLSPSASILSSLSVHLETSALDLSPFSALNTLTVVYGYYFVAVATLRTCRSPLQHLTLAAWAALRWTIEHYEAQDDSFAALLAHLPPTLVSLDLASLLKPSSSRGGGRPHEDERGSLLQAVRTDGWLPRLKRLEVAVEVEMTQWGRLKRLGEWKEEVRQACEEREVELVPNEEGTLKERREREQREMWA
ncbi:hypothetical protein JCM6882_008612 [Rhodosporidiobolus microsporus]